MTHERKKIPKRCWMDFRNPLVGATKRVSTRSHQIRKQINVDWTAIDRLTRNLSKTGRHKGLEIVRNQIPLVAANGMTITKSQGSSIPVVVVSVKRFRNQLGKLTRKLSRELLYVACSRATSLNGLYIDGEFEAPAPPPANDPVSLEMDRLRNIPFRFKLRFLQDSAHENKLFFHNVQSFSAHVADVLADNCATKRLISISNYFDQCILRIHVNLCSSFSVTTWLLLNPTYCKVMTSAYPTSIVFIEVIVNGIEIPKVPLCFLEMAKKSLRSTWTTLELDTAYLLSGVYRI
jgi:hypothetical protein